MKTLHHSLIDPEDPHCLYCQGQFDIGFDGEQSIALGGDKNKETFTCRECGEIFEIYSVQSVDGETSYKAFLFTCRELCVQYIYSGQEFQIGDHNLLGNGHLKRPKKPIEISVFSVDFSDKEKLYEKLKTYLIFS